MRSDRGYGKTTMMANWVKQFDLENPEVKVISHFVGCSGRSRDLTTFLRRCIAELREEYLRDGLYQLHWILYVNIVFLLNQCGKTKSVYAIICVYIMRQSARSYCT